MAVPFNERRHRAAGRNRLCKLTALKWTGRIITKTHREQAVIALVDDLVIAGRLAQDVARLAQ